VKDFKIIEILRTFKKEELKLFDKFLESPFIKSRRNLHPILEGILKYYPEFLSPELTKENLFKELFVKEDYNDKKIMNLIFDLTKAAEDFLVHKAVDEDEIGSMMYLCRAYYKTKMLDSSMKVIKGVEKIIEPNFSTSYDYFSKLKQILAYKEAYLTEQNDFDKLINIKLKYFEASATQFIIDYTELLSYKETMLQTYDKKIESNFIKSVVESFNMEKFIKLTEKASGLNTNLILLHYYRLKTVESPNDLNHYYELRDFFYKIIDTLSRSEKYFVFSHLVNYCVQQFGKNFEEVKLEGLNVYKKMIENDAFSSSESEHMQTLTYRNIIQFCLTNKDAKWMEYFINEYTEKLSPEIRNDLKNFAFADLHFMEKNFDKALEFTSKINHEFFLFKMDLKNLLLNIYYELNYTEPAFSLVDSYKHFIANSKEISELHKETIKNYLKYYLIILKIKTKQSKEDIGEMKQKIKNEKKIVFRGWMLGKLEELSKKG